MNKKLIVLCVLLALASAQLAADIPAVTAPNCGVGYVFSNDICIACAAGCATCTDPWGCTTCTQNYVRVSTTVEASGCYLPQTTQPDGTTLNGITYTKSTNCATDCVDLSGKTLGCTTCNTGFGLSKNDCVGCPASCATCTFDAGATVGKCTKCTYGYYMKDTTCTICPTTITNCGQCDATGTKCDICNVGFYAVSGACVACASPAASCDSTGKVLTCATGYFLDITVPATPKCTACATGCLKCTSATICTTCTWVGYQLTSSVCTACADANAVYCDASKVIQCKTTHFVSANTCKARIDNCIKHVADGTKCDTCRKGYVWSEGACKAYGSAGQLLYCTAATNAVDALVATKAVCTTCAANPTTGNTKTYVIDVTTKACVACPDQASACTATNGVFSALTCGSGYAINQAGTACLDCAGIKAAYCKQNTTANATKPKCIQSDGSTVCVITAAGAVDAQSAVTAAVYVPTDACADGYMLTAASAPEGLTCVPCAAGCKTCSVTADATKCLSCFTGYYFTAGNTTGACAKCTATTSNSCTTCGQPKRSLTGTTSEWVALVGTTCTIIADATSTTNGVQNATTGVLASCSNGYQLLATGNTNAGSCVTCVTAVAAASDCTLCTGVAATAGYVCSACTTSTNTLQGTATITSCLSDSNCGQIAAYKCAWCKLGYNLGTDGKCVACATGCTFTCPLPTSAAAAAAAAAAAKAASSGSFLTFAFSAIVLVLAALF